MYFRDIVTQRCLNSTIYICAVAPHAGAWIETRKGGYNLIVTEVAPHAGAWIETRKNDYPRKPCHVAPHAGAWIETLML